MDTKQFQYIYSLKVSTYLTLIIFIITLGGYFKFTSFIINLMFSISFLILFIFSYKNFKKIKKNIINKKKMILTYFIALLLIIFSEFISVLIEFSISDKAYFRGLTSLFILIYLHAIYSAFRFKKKF